MKEYESIEQLHDEVRAACPTPAWTVVEVEWQDHSGKMVWWCYAEPSSSEQPDRDARVAVRENATNDSRRRALRHLRNRLRERYVVERLMTP